MYQDLICLPRYYILIIFVIIMCFIGLYVFEKHNKYQSINNHYYKLPEQKLPEQKLYLENNIGKRDQDVLYNDFAPPERRNPINIRTRGEPDSYQLLGVLLRDNTETAYKLFGRPKYNGSSQYEYYVQGVMHDNNIKLPIKIKGDKEIDDNQIVEIPGTNASKGEFKVKLYNFDLPRYL